MRRKFNKIPKLHVRRGDQVVVLSGDKDLKGQRGQVVAVFPKKRRAVVEGLNIVKRHIRGNRANNQPGRIAEFPASLHVSKLMVINPNNNLPTRISRKYDPTKGWVRVAKRGGHQLDQ
jgi:large subunit ribosomal protein L24